MIFKLYQQKMQKTIEQFISDLTEEFNKAIAVKTGWGYRELQILLQQCIVRALLSEKKIIDKSNEPEEGFFV